jgi:hypothetical protein
MADLKSEASREEQRKDHDKFSETEEKLKSRPRWQYEHRKDLYEQVAVWPPS